MTIEHQPTAPRSRFHCGPTMMITMAILIVIAIAALFMLQGHNRLSAPQGPAQPITSGGSSSSN